MSKRIFIAITLITCISTADAGERRREQRKSAWESFRKRTPKYDSNTTTRSPSTTKTQSFASIVEQNRSKYPLQQTQKVYCGTQEKPFVLTIPEGTYEQSDSEQSDNEDNPIQTCKERPDDWYDANDFQETLKPDTTVEESKKKFTPVLEEIKRARVKKEHNEKFSKTLALIPVFKQAQEKAKQLEKNNILQGTQQPVRGSEKKPWIHVRTSPLCLEEGTPTIKVVRPTEEVIEEKGQPIQTIVEETYSFAADEKETDPYMTLEEIPTVENIPEFDGSEGDDEKYAQHLMKVSEYLQTVLGSNDRPGPARRNVYTLTQKQSELLAMQEQLEKERKEQSTRKHTCATQIARLETELKQTEENLDVVMQELARTKGKQTSVRHTLEKAKQQRDSLRKERDQAEQELAEKGGALRSTRTWTEATKGALEWITGSNSQ